MSDRLLPLPATSASFHARRDNRASTLAEKLALRHEAAEWLAGQAHVLEVFCGVSAEMWAGAWRDRCASYVGLDQSSTQLEVRDVRHGDAFERLGELDLGMFDCFDVDAWGSPWRIVRAIAGARRWRAHERGALVVTDGSSKQRRYGIEITDQRWFAAGLPTLRSERMSAGVVVAGLRAFARLSDVRAGALRRAVGRHGRGAIEMQYAVLLFEGLA